MGDLTVPSTAISTLLQPPIVRTGMLPHTNAPPSAAHKPPSAKDIPPVALANIPHADPQVFKTYISQVGPLYEVFQRSKQDAERERAKAQKQEKEKTDNVSEASERRSRKESSASIESSGGQSVTGTSGGRRRSSGGLSKRVQVAPLSTIPNVYFDENFRLENPRTFDIVSERSEVVRTPHASTIDETKETNGFASGPAPVARKALATNAILQEKLSWYMDTVEVHLISSISSASTSFFAALGSLRELQSEAAQSAIRIQELRKDLQALDQNMALGGLKIIGMKRRRANLEKLSEAVEQLNAIVHAVTRCEELVEAGDLDVSLDRLETVSKLVSGDIHLDGSTNVTWLQAHLPSQLIDLRELRALDGLNECLRQLRLRIGKGYEIRFLEALLGDLREHVKAVKPVDTMQRWGATFQRSRGESRRSATGFPAYLNVHNELRRELRASLNGLSRSQYTNSSAVSFREAVMKEMKVLIRQHLPSSSDDDTESVTSVSTRSSRMLSQQDKSAILARNLRSLEPEAADELLVNIYANVGEALRRLSIQVKVLLDVTSGVSSPPVGTPRSPPRSPNMASIDAYMSPKSPQPALQEELLQALDMSSLLGQAVDVAQTQITKVLKVRTEQTVRLPLKCFLRYFTLNRLFADECEAISGRSGAALKSVINNQIVDFLKLFGDSEKQRLAERMDADRWEAKDFGMEENAVLDRILVSSTSNPPEWLKSSAVWEGVIESKANGVTTADGEPKEVSKEKTKNATVDEQQYIIVDSAIAALSGIDHFCNFIVAIPSMTSDTAGHMVEYLRLFNSKCTQLVLGAGATRTAGLANINTKHLALASQALSFMTAVIPYLREFVRRNAPPTATTVMAAFDQVKRLFQDHQSQIHEKLIDIMSMRATVHVRTMKKIDWDTDEREVSPHIETLTKETATLYRVLTKYLPEAIVRSIMGPVFESYRDQWATAFREANLSTEKGKQRYVPILLSCAEIARIVNLAIGFFETPKCSIQK
jgi:vacuolar protein sorting-associated protein 54